MDGEAEAGLVQHLCWSQAFKSMHCSWIYTASINYEALWSGHLLKGSMKGGQTAQQLSLRSERREGGRLKKRSGE